MAVRTRAQIFGDLRNHPERHRHGFEELIACCTVDGILDMDLIERHTYFVDLGKNGGVRCDVTSGPCSCGAWHY